MGQPKGVKRSELWEARRARSYYTTATQRRKDRAAERYKADVAYLEVLDARIVKLEAREGMDRLIAEALAAEVGK